MAVDGEEIVVSKIISVHCPFGSHGPMFVELTHEDEEIVQWDGACGECGRELNLMHVKEQP